MRVILAQGSCPMLQILDVSSQKKKRDHAALLPKNIVCTCHPCTKRSCKIFSAEKKVQLTPCRREKSSFLRRLPNNSVVDFSLIFALLGEQSRVPAFRTSRTLWAASQAVDEWATHQESVPLLHSSFLDFVPKLWPWIWACTMITC